MLKLFLKSTMVYIILRQCNKTCSMTWGAVLPSKSSILQSSNWYWFGLYSDCLRWDITFWLQCTQSLLCACVFAALYAGLQVQLHNRHTRVCMQIMQHAHTHTPVTRFKPKSHSLVEDNPTTLSWPMQRLTLRLFTSFVETHTGLLIFMRPTCCRLLMFGLVYLSWLVLSQDHQCVSTEWQIYKQTNYQSSYCLHFLDELSLSKH